jgi:hypothetical protein
MSQKERDAFVAGVRWLAHQETSDPMTLEAEHAAMVRYPDEPRNPFALMSGPVGKDSRRMITCPRCEGQKFDKGTCSLCNNTGLIDPEPMEIVAPAIKRLREHGVTDNDLADDIEQKLQALKNWNPALAAQLTAQTWEGDHTGMHWDGLAGMWRPDKP